MAGADYYRQRRVSFAAHEEEDAGEGEPLLLDSEQEDNEDGCFPAQDWPDFAPRLNPHADLPVYATIHR